MRSIPSYSEVMTGLTSKETHQAFVCLEVMGVTGYSDMRDNAIDFLSNMAETHNWQYDHMMDILEEEYNTLYEK